MTLRVANLVPVTEAEGPGKRFAIWLQGCPLRCPGCCNPEMLSFNGGEEIPVAELLRQVREAAGQHRVEGVTLLGGEPFAHAEAAARLARGIRRAGLTVMIFSGYTLDELRAQQLPAVTELLSHTDLLVDGRYDRDLPESERRWIGSANQQVHFLSDRYHADDGCWRRPNTLEIRFDGRQVLVNGFPAPAAAGIWKQLDR
jgi:anaerobic ribonucleoside-triphosphate reductase activating protein